MVAERIPLIEARRAHENLGRGGITGKQILICDQEITGGTESAAESVSRKAAMTGRSAKHETRRAETPR